MRGLDKYREILSDCALELAKKFPVPWDPTQLCQHMGVQLLRNGKRKNPVLHFSLDGAVIILPEKRSRPRFERFQIAHELGHLVLLNECGAAPTGPSEYWQHEDLCDWFARELLLPAQIIRPVLEQIPVQAERFLEFSTLLVDSYNVTWKTAACRISELNPLSLFIAIVPCADDKRAQIKFSSARNRKFVGGILQESAELTDYVHRYRDTKMVSLQLDEIRLQMERIAPLDSCVATWAITELRVALIKAAHG